MYETSEYKVTYLLGAGASANALPTVKETDSNPGFAKALLEFAKRIGEDEEIDPSHNTFVIELCGSLEWIAENTKKFGTPDTFAKFLYLKDRPNLDRLQKALSFYFVVEQLFEKKRESRVLPFLTSILEQESIFPKNIKILNWNYDFQIQLAAEEFIREVYGVSTNGTYIHSPALVNYYPQVGHGLIQNDDTSSKEFDMIHLNGLAGAFNVNGNSQFLNHFVFPKPENINKLIQTLTDAQTSTNLLTYAWETNTNPAFHIYKRIFHAKSIASETDILVIIGYSFPFFNRNVDKAIFEAVKGGAKLKKIYYQDPYRSGEFLKKQFDLDDSIEILHIKEVESYFIPNEL